MRKEKRAKLDARKSRRELYYSAGVPHFHTLPEHARISSLLTNYPSLRTFKSPISSDVVELTARFNFYLSLAFPVKGSSISYYLESVTEHLGQRLSNYTLSGFICSKQHGPRHKPTKSTIAALNTLILWLEECCRVAGIWEPFNFKYHIAEYDQQRGLVPKPTNNETKKSKTSSQDSSEEDRPKGKSKLSIAQYAALLEWHRQGEGDSG